MWPLRLASNTFVTVAVTTAVAISLAECSSETGSQGTVKEPPVKPSAEIVFPDSLHVQDTTVNQFVRRAMLACASDNYDEFRSLWSVKQEPMSRQEFEKGWRAVKQIQVLALEKAMIETAAGTPGQPADIPPTVVYLAFAEVYLDPALAAGRKEPSREVALMLIREHDEWRIAQPTKIMREWIREKAKSRTQPGGESPMSTMQPDT